METAQWRLIEYDRHDASFNMAVDEAIASAVEFGASPPTLRFYGWSRPSLTVGAFQKIETIDTEACSILNIPVVRRPTGGRAILHDDELTFSFSTGTLSAPFSDNLLQNYKVIASAFVLAFKRLGLDCEMTERRLRHGDIYRDAVQTTGNPLCFSAASYSEVTIDGRKILGAAQKRYRSALLEQGSIPLSVNRDLISRVFVGTRTEDLDYGLAGLREFVASIEPSNVAIAVAEAFCEVFRVGFLRGQLTAEEDSLARTLQRRYLLRRWTFRK